MGKKKTQQDGKIGESQMEKDLKGDDKWVGDYKVKLYDQYYMKMAVDDEIIKILDRLGYKENHTRMDVKIVAGTIACILAAVTYLHVHVMKEDFNLMVACVALYIIITSAMTVHASLFDDGSFVRTYANVTTPSLAGVKCFSKMPKYDPKYTCFFCPLSASSNKAAVSTFDIMINEYFDTEGRLLKEKLAGQVEKYLKEYHAKKAE
mmetsp:Transcript_17772/g.44084  ORF Transcript_17772/g.44084 Transcript_17772/m.44084 type:complete len:206 (-) Transcript_17772:650-1267(-)|eukprot:CAMPEP_0113883612 /NCGR_PEP_ID=MMETSP0780_2-20120614/9716_1 /TAXON_ID=652834 /ORGANISM="Palpitomonas bilix" /LENGTH=205 /DNA_ID=CAMNT_0000870975 /DNA_START=122 /DNA_END=739 /DNA_ORIENTATION=+ /assembly_acc=CAM_ASM_000599